MDTNQTASSNEPLWTAVDVARYLNISRSSVYGLASRGALTAVRIGALLRFQPQTVRAYASTVRLPARVVSLKARGPAKGDHSD